MMNVCIQKLSMVMGLLQCGVILRVGGLKNEQYHSIFQRHAIPSGSCISGEKIHPSTNE